MEAGEKEQRKAFEEITKRNVQAAVDHGNETRRMVRELEIKVRGLQNIIASKDRDMTLIKEQLAVLQTRVYSKGTADDNFG